MTADREVKPSQVDGQVGFFDRFATTAAGAVARAPFFAFCVLLVLIWAPTLFLMPVDTSQLIINTATTIITFLLVALLQNTSSRADAAVQKKLNAIADALADFLEADPNVTLHQAAGELRSAVGLELRETA